MIRVVAATLAAVAVVVMVVFAQRIELFLLIRTAPMQIQQQQRQPKKKKKSALTDRLADTAAAVKVVLIYLTLLALPKSLRRVLTK